MSEVAQKWGDAVARRGFAQVPNYLLLLNQFLDEDSRLSPVELLLLVQLVGTWWRRDQMPFPAVKTLAVRCGVSDRQIQRSIGRLEKLGLLSKEKRRSKTGVIASNAYNLQPAVKFLEEVARMFPNEYPRKLERISPPLIEDAHASQETPERPKKPLRRLPGLTKRALDL